jgi:zinc and cadmium transporter
MSQLLIILLATIFVSLGSLVGVFSYVVNIEKLDKHLIFPVSLSTGALLGGAFIHLLPEAVHHLNPEITYEIVLLAIIIFFLIEKLLHWHHCHKDYCKVHTFAHMSLIGDAIHNFIDGLIIAATFLVSYKVGLVTTLAIALHEIPQEVGDFGVLLYAGYSKKKALFSNIFVSFTALLGGILGYFLNIGSQYLLFLLIPFAAGGFIYIAVSDLMPEVRTEINIKKSLLSFFIILLGVAIVQLFTFFE